MGQKLRAQNCSRLFLIKTVTQLVSSLKLVFIFLYKRGRRQGTYLLEGSMDTPVIESMKHPLMTPGIFWHIWQTQDVSLDRQRAMEKLFSNLRILKKLAECLIVCREWRRMIDSWRGQHCPIAQFPTGEVSGWVGEHPLFEQYRRNAEDYIVRLPNVMSRRWRSPEIPLEMSVFDRLQLIRFNA